MTQSTDGRDWARLSHLAPGHRVVADGGFTCIPEGATKVVKMNDHGERYVRCRSGEHGLDGQIDRDGDSLVGFWPA